MWHAKTSEEVIRELETDVSTGLTESEVLRRRERYGWNELRKGKSKSLLAMILEQFEDLMVIILLVAAGCSTVIAFFDHEEGLLGYVEPIVILLILFANAAVGVWQESNAEAAIEALKDMQPQYAKALRDGVWKTLLSRELVPGDIVDISVGEQIPADIRILELKTPTLRVTQASLTGETVDISKHNSPILKDDAIIQDKLNIAFSTSNVTSGYGIGAVIATGMETEIGKVQSQVEDAQANEETTPLQQKLEEFGELLAKVILFICLLVWLMNFKNFFDEAHGGAIRGAIYYFKIAIALAVAAVPEGLPAVITTCLALGTRRMAKRNAIVRKLPSVETLGCTSVICSDKTGTLTTNEMTVTHMFVPGATSGQFRDYEVTGHSFNPAGKVEGLTSEALTSLRHFMLSSVLCNDSRVDYNGKWKVTGMPTEAALRILVEKMGQYDKNFERRNPEENPQQYGNLIQAQYNKIVTLEFTRERKSMSVLCRGKTDATNTLFVKGAPESIIERCSRIQLSTGTKQTFTNDLKEQVNEKARELSSKALRCLALAYTDSCGPLADYDGPKHARHSLLQDYSNFEKLESDLIFLGLVGMEDPPRPEVAAAIATCKKAGIRVFMITGDNQLTAEAIARRIHILDADDKNHSFTGREYDRMPTNESQRLLASKDCFVFSRTEPSHKRKLVEQLKSIGEIVAMTGDGVNDAPALSEAQIGVAMGIAGTEVAKAASAMILADDNFSTIVAAVEEGRGIYNNTKAFIRYLISSNIGEVASIFLTAMLGVPETFTSVQLLWVNLVTDGPPATALSFNPPDPDIMQKPPRKSDEPLITPWVFFRYFVIGTYVGIATVGIFVYWYTQFEGEDGHPLVTYEQLSNWSECPSWKDFTLPDYAGLPLSKHPCLYFTEGKTVAATLSLSVLVTIEMLNALNALSEDCSLLEMPPWVNPWLLLAIVGSMGMHMVILYVPFLNQVFGIAPIYFKEWVLVLVFSFPVVIIDEVLKAYGRSRDRRKLKVEKSH